MPVWLILGWLTAAVLANRLFASGIVSYEVLYDSLRQGWSLAAERGFAVVLRVLVLRVLGFLAILWMLNSRGRQAGIRFLLFVFGLSAGLSLVLMTWCRGMLGLVLFLMAGFPQELFYLSALGILFYRYAFVRETMKIRFWGTVVLLFLLGILCEIWINPMITKYF